MIKDFLQKRKKDIFFLFILLFLSIFSLRQFFPKGIFYAHDTIHHVVRLGNLVEELKVGQIPVRLATKMAYGHSYPVFNYTYPLPYYLASMAYFLGFSLVESLKLVFFFSTILSILVFYLLLRLDNKEASAFFGAILYLFVPFRFLSIFVTAQLGIVLVFLFAPLSLYFFRLLLKGNNNKKIIVCFAMSLAAIILSHLISVIILLAFFVLYFLIHFLKIENKKGILLSKRLLISFFLALLLSAFYLLPAIFEVSNIRAGLMETVVYSDNFISFKQLFYSKWGYGFSNPGFSDQLSFQLGIAQWIIIIFSGLVLVLRRGKKLLSYYLLFCLTLFLMTQQSEYIWKVFPLLQKIQHPWRLLLTTSILLPLIGMESLRLIKSNIIKKVFIFTLVLIAIYTNRNYLRPMETDVRYDDQHYLENTRSYYGSSDVSWEFLPRWVPEEPRDFSEYLIDPAILQLAVEEKESLGLDQSWKIQLAEAAEVNLNVFYFPSWQVELDGQKQEIYPNQDGLISLSVPAGEHQLRLFLGNTNLATFANLLSVLGLIISLIIIIL